MSEKKANNTLSEKLKEKVAHKIPDDFDLSLIGKIDLHEAEKIANEEIIFLSEDDLIDGLEDFELIPVKSSGQSYPVFKEKTEQPESVSIDLPGMSTLKDDVADEILFEDFSENTSESVVIRPEHSDSEISELDVNTLIDETPDSLTTEVQVSDVLIPVNNEADELTNETDEFLFADETDIIEFDLDEIISNETPDKKNHNESEILKKRIDEGGFDHQLDDIVKSGKSDDEFDFIPGIYDDSNIGTNIKFIDDSYVEKKSRDLSPAFEADPLTENLVRMVDISEGKMLVIDEIAEPHERIEYILDDSKTYDAESLALLFKEERFMDDSDFDFIDNAIIRDDYTVFIQEIDEYLKSREALSSSEVYEILGLLPEEIQDIDDKLFGKYYKELDDEYELEFLSPELSFFDRGFVKKKELSYFINDAGSLFDDEKKSIEDDITSESAIIFEEDVAEIERLLNESDSGWREDDKNPELLEIHEIREINDIDEFEEKTQVIGRDSAEIIDITDRIIILEDKTEIERITSEFPEKHDDLVKLLSYLDGLLEKLPEELIRKFAESEYFDLYAKVLKEIGNK